MSIAGPNSLTNRVKEKAGIQKLPAKIHFREEFGHSHQL